LLAKLQEIAKLQGEEIILIKRELNQDEKIKIAHLGRWTKSDILADANKFTTLKEWTKRPAYQAACKYGILAEAKKHLISNQRPKGFWTKERVINDAKKYYSRKEWAMKSHSAYNAAFKNDWLSEATMHMPELRKTWDLESCKLSALNFDTRTKWQKGEGGAYNYALRERLIASRYTKSKKLNEINNVVKKLSG